MTKITTGAFVAIVIMAAAVLRVAIKKQEQKPSKHGTGGQKMNLIQACELMSKYAVCPKCGSETIGDRAGSVECDTSTGYFKRTCECGWSIEIKEV